MEKNTLLYHFHYILINEILPFEAKYVSIRKYKDFNLIREIIKYYFSEVFPNLGNTLTKNEFNQIYMNKINTILLRNKTDYIEILMNEYKSYIEKKNKKTSLKKFFKIESGTDVRVIKDKIDDLILELDTIIGIENSLIEKHQLYIENVDTLIDNNIYKDELEILQNKVKKFHKYFIILENILDKSGFLEKLEKQEIKVHDNITNLEYLYFVVIHEFWNYLAHLSMGIIYFNSPNTFLSNINKSISHLKRAIMDLLDGIILEFNCSKKQEYLKLRVMKIASLGNRTKMQDLIKELEKVFENCDSIKEINSHK